jgi:uncharacterized protein (TIGR03083 family)
VTDDPILVLTAATDRFATLVETTDPTLAVPSCPDWRVADLVGHIGEVHQWARHAVVAGNPDGVAEDAPEDATALGSWYRTHATALVDVLATTDPAAPAWTFDRSDRTAGWWVRRQVNETVMHTWDLLAAHGGEADWAPDPVLSWDGVDEVATMFYPRQVRLGRTEPLPGTLRLVATDVPHAAPITIGDAGAVVEVAGQAADLLLLVWQRRSHPDPAAADLLGRAIAP